MPRLTKTIRNARIINDQFGGLCSALPKHHLDCLIKVHGTTVLTHEAIDILAKRLLATVPRAQAAAAPKPKRKRASGTR